MVSTSGGETQDQLWFSKLFPCCGSCYTRKGHEFPADGKRITASSRRIVMLGAVGVGKSEAIALLMGAKTAGAYEPTNGSRTVKLVIESADLQLVEVGGSLREFWPRTLTSRTDALWYMLSGDTSLDKELISFTEFIRECSSVIAKEKIMVLVTIAGPTTLPPDRVSALVSKATHDAGVYDSPMVEAIPAPSESAFRTVLTNLLVKLGSH